MNRRHRLRGRRAFTAVRDRRVVAASGALRVHAAANQLPVTRVGFVIPRSVGGAVVRNRIRRRLRAALAPRLEALAGTDLVVVVRPGAAELGGGALIEQLGQCLDALSGRIATTSGARVEDNGGSRAPECAARPAASLLA